MRPNARTFAIAVRSMLSVLALAPVVSFAETPTELDETRAQLILEAFNSKPDELIAPLARDQIHIQSGQGRVDINPKAKFSYFIQTANSTDPKSPILLLPLATSRFAPNYYQTDEWWDAHSKEIDEAKAAGQRPPKQDMGEVKVWLAQNKLSTNPLVLEIDPATRETKRTRLRDYLLNFLIEHYGHDGVITLYRGAEKAGEIETIERGEVPKGMRYWTPTADYAWRYARKNSNFLEELVAGRAPLLVFRISVDELKAFTAGSKPEIVLGSELTKNAHSSFDSRGVFMDHLYQMIFPGTGDLGVEIELRSTRRGSQKMVSKFLRPVTIEELAADRIQVISRARDRISLQYPDRADETKGLVERRIKRILLESDILVALKNNLPQEFVSELLSELSYGTAEIGYIDAIDFESFVRSKMSALPSDADRTEKLRKDRADRTGLFTLKAGNP